MSQLFYPTSCFQLVMIHTSYPCHCPVGREPLKNLECSGMGWDLSCRNWEMEGRRSAVLYQNSQLSTRTWVLLWMNWLVKLPCYFQHYYWCTQAACLLGAHMPEWPSFLSPAFLIRFVSPAPPPIPPHPASSSFQLDILLRSVRVPWPRMPGVTDWRTDACR